MVEFFADSLVNGFMQSSMMGKGIVLVQLAASVVMVAVIIGKVKEAHLIDTNKCIKCGTCIDKCKFGAISRG